MKAPEKQTIAIVVYSLACLGLSFVIVECSGRNAQRDIQAAKAETIEARAALSVALAENATLREYTRRSDEAVLRATTAIQEALGKHEERRKSIDNSSPDWLMCELPGGVRDSFADYAACGGNRAAVGASGALREASGLRNGD